MAEVSSGDACEACGQRHGSATSCSTLVRAEGEGPAPRPRCPVASEEADPLVGARLGSFRLVRRLGRGGMGTVYLGEHVSIGSRVAVKVLHEHLAMYPELVQRFHAEARAVNVIGHENIVSIFDLNAGPPRPYLIMEYLDGAPLSAWVGTPLPAPAVVSVLSQVCDALQAAHLSGIVHRDLKPDNIFLVRRGRGTPFVKVLDFGIAKLADANMPQTHAGIIVGTPEYMAPEQSLSRRVDGRADLYALGVIAYQLVTGRLPFEDEGLTAQLVAHQMRAPPPPRSVHAAVPVALERVILRTLAKAPEERYTTAAILRAALEGALAEEARARTKPARPPGTPPAPVRTVPPAISPEIVVMEDAMAPWSPAPRPVSPGWASSPPRSAPVAPPRLAPPVPVASREGAARAGMPVGAGTPPSPVAVASREGAARAGMPFGAGTPPSPAAIASREVGPRTGMPVGTGTPPAPVAIASREGAPRVVIPVGLGTPPAPVAIASREGAPRVGDPVGMGAPSAQALVPMSVASRGGVPSVGAALGSGTPSSRARTVELPVRVVLRPGETPVWLTGSDLSRGGLFLRSEGVLPPIFARLPMVLELDSGPQSVVCEVVRHVPEEQARVWGMATGFGVQFVEATLALKASVDALLRAGPNRRPPPPLVPMADDAEAAHVLESYRTRLAGDHYAVLAVPPDLEMGALRTRTREARGSLESLRQRPLSPSQCLLLDSVLGRLHEAGDVLGTVTQRALYDAWRGNHRGVARCLEAGLTSEQLDSLRREFLARRPQSAGMARVHYLSGSALEREGQLSRALETYERGLALDPLESSLHHRYRTVRRALDARGASERTNDRTRPS
ncbi:protein kinase [Myxococcus sp. CA051A]|uniref:protein kinase domain-containing protein n=1 Tax=Myxococcus sp. CA051A TaxID=2741739 RepID=UPI0020C655C0|nr:protein kinase [Myxococcus sp. CA051A]